jgi:hypothetical protein
METAFFENRMVSVGVFQRMRKSADDMATCPLCDEFVFLSGVRSLKKTASFNHHSRKDSEAKCSLSYSTHPSYEWLKNVDIEEIESRAAALKAAFFQTDNLKKAFTFLTSLAGKGAVSSAVFALLLQKADKLEIWKYAGLPVWAVPYILLTLTDFVVRRPSKPAYIVRFIVDKPPRSKVNATWLTPGQCKLVKYFVNDGKATKMFRSVPSTPAKSATRASSFPVISNPLAFSAEEFARITANTAWIKGGLINFFAELEMEPEVETAELSDRAGQPETPVRHANVTKTAEPKLKEDSISQSRPTPPQAQANPKSIAQSTPTVNIPRPAPSGTPSPVKANIASALPDSLGRAATTPVASLGRPAASARVATLPVPNHSPGAAIYTAESHRADSPNKVSDTEPSTFREQNPGARSSTASGEYGRRLPVNSDGVGEKDTSRRGNPKVLESNPEVRQSGPMPKGSNRLVSWLRKLFT